MPPIRVVAHQHGKLADQTLGVPRAAREGVDRGPGDGAELVAPVGLRRGTGRDSGVLAEEQIVDGVASGGSAIARTPHLAGANSSSPENAANL